MAKNGKEFLEYVILYFGLAQMPKHCFKGTGFLQITSEAVSEAVALLKLKTSDYL
jgi:hypothetical protein